MPSRIKSNKTYFIFLLAFILTPFLSTAQQSTEEKFNSGKLMLSQNKFWEASEVFNKLLKEDQNNSNLKFLLGQSLVQADTNLDYAIELLDESAQNWSPIYSFDYKERHSSEYVYFYLLKGYSLNGQCDSTLQTLVKLYSIYSYENEWYLVKGQELHRECMAKDVPEEVKVADSISFKKDPVVVGTRTVTYTDRTANYGVQIASMVAPVFTYNFKGLSNIEVYVDENGVYRYIIGSFLYKQQAEKLLETIVEKGYEDAFVVNTKDKTRFSEEVVTINNVPITKQIVGRVDFRVQVGAYTATEMPDELMEIYLTHDSIKVIPQEGYTVMTMGSFTSYEEAEFYKELLVDLGIEDAFVVAFNYNTKIEIQEAAYYLESQKEAQKEAEAEENTKKKKKKKKSK